MHISIPKIYCKQEPFPIWSMKIGCRLLVPCRYPRMPCIARQVWSYGQSIIQPLSVHSCQSPGPLCPVSMYHYRLVKAQHSLPIFKIKIFKIDFYTILGVFLLLYQCFFCIMTTNTSSFQFRKIIQKQVSLFDN